MRGVERPGTQTSDYSSSVSGPQFGDRGPRQPETDPIAAVRAGLTKVESLTLVIPSHNESGSLGKVVLEYWANRPRGVALEILVVDDASNDDTPESLGSLQKVLPIRVIRNPVSLGFGGALKVGMAHTHTPWVAFTDADGQYDSRDLPILIAVLESGHDLALGWRTRRADPFLRTAISVGFRALLFIFFRHAARDPTTSLRAGRTEAIQSVAARTRYMNGSFWNEFLIRWRLEDLSYAEVPIRHLPRMNGKSKVASTGLVSKAAAQQFIALLRVWRELHRPQRTVGASSALAPDGP